MCCAVLKTTTEKIVTNSVTINEAKNFRTFIVYTDIPREGNEYNVVESNDFPTKDPSCYWFGTSGCKKTFGYTT